ncbi:hypothetical protein PSHT_01738 [Puccinia striiformis]|uniref:Repressor of RNA polymerase III transcription MAF1 n=1 Tax=Puccinia striiformis TaxID=27350 RepID=A0A2S4WJU9_9BASI|nr:hypothetical protein PSHT_01738 [Puccinia striiformis]
MKYLETPELGLLASMLSDSSHSVRTMTRIEAYSCKSVASERKLIKSLEQEFTSDLEITTASSSPEGLSSSNALESAFGRLDRKDSRKTFWLLIATLNAAYPDHNFSGVKVEDFQAESQAVLTKISEALELDRSGGNFASTLGALSTSPECLPKKSSAIPPEDSQSHINTSSLTAIHPLIRQILDPVIDLSHCDVYSYSPDADSDPHAVVSDDEEEDVESVASSIYGSNRHDLLQHSYPADIHDETMWEIEGVDPPTYIHPTTTTHTHPSISTTESSFYILTEISRSTRRSSELKFKPQPSSDIEESETPPLSPLSISGSDSMYEDESAGGLLWSSHYFFYNRKMKRILFISTWGRKASIHSTSFNTEPQIQSSANGSSLSTIPFPRVEISENLQNRSRRLNPNPSSSGTKRFDPISSSSSKRQVDSSSSTLISNLSASRSSKKNRKTIARSNFVPLP